MATLRGYSVYDNKALCYHAPFFAVTDGAAVRSFTDLVNDPNTTVGRHPGDYSLWNVGDFQDHNGHILPILPPRHVIDAMALVMRQEPLPLDPMPPNQGARGNGVSPEKVAQYLLNNPEE